MRVFLILVRREFGTYFTSLTGYVIISAVLFLIGFSFTEILDRLNNDEPITLPVTEVFYQTWYFWYILLLSAPLITMRAFALEKAAGTCWPPSCGIRADRPKFIAEVASQSACGVAVGMAVEKAHEDGLAWHEGGGGGPRSLRLRPGRWGRKGSERCMPMWSGIGVLLSFRMLDRISVRGPGRIPGHGTGACWLPRRCRHPGGGDTHDSGSSRPRTRRRRARTPGVG